MFQAAIFYMAELSDSSRAAKRTIEELYNPEIARQGGEQLSVAAYVTNQAESAAVLDDTAMIGLWQFCKLYEKGAMHAIIVPIEYCVGQTAFVPLFLQLGIDVQDIYLTRRIDGETVSLEEIRSFIVPYLSSRSLGYLEFHIADQCNLNCKACEHYSGLVPEPRYPDYDKFEQDFERLHELIDDIGLIRILGGEPLLNPEIERYIVLARRLYPRSVIAVVTNAILLPSMPESFYRTVREQDVYIWISYYPLLKGKMEKITAFVEERDVKLHLTPLAERFRMRQTLQPHDHPEKTFFNCFQALCNNLYDGKVAACFLPFTTKYFNEYFNKSLPEDGAIDLWNPSLTTEELKASLLLPLERCRHCADVKEVAWDRIKNPSELSDWVLE